MIILENEKRFYNAGWFLAAIFIIGVNGFAFVSAFSPPEVERSKETRLMGQKWRELDDKLSAALKNSFNNINPETIAERFSPIKNSDNKELFPKKNLAEEFKTETENEISLPILDGIFSILDDNGHYALFALIEGRKMKRHDRIRGFTINKIDPKGVTLVRDGITRFVPLPEIPFSMNRQR